MSETGDQSPIQIELEHSTDTYSNEDKLPLQNSEDMDEIIHRDSTSKSAKVFSTIYNGVSWKTLLACAILLIISYIIVKPSASVSKPIETFQKTYTFPHLTTIKGKHDEAYAFFLCTRRDADNTDQMHFEALLVILYRLQKAGENDKRDIIVIVCQHNSFEEYETLLGLKNILVIPVQTINPVAVYHQKRWIDVFTRFSLMKLIHYNRLLVMDVDIFVIKDSFYQIWDEPATQVKYSPPSNYTNSTYFGAQVKDLYPFLHSAAIDTFYWDYNKNIRKFNAGLLLIKPSLNIFKILMDISFGTTFDLVEVDQTAGNILFHKDGALPWDQFSELYNFFPDFNNMDERVKAYHCKVWVKDPPARYQNISDMWHKHYAEMKRNWQLPYPLDQPPDYLFVGSNTTSISIAGLKITSPKDAYYALATPDLVIIPTAEQIKIANQSVSVVMNETITITVSGLNSNTTYVIHYYQHMAASDKVSDVHYVQYSTTA